MAGKSKHRYFQQNNSRSRSPNYDRQQQQKYDAPTSKFADNKSASERFKKSLQDQSMASTSKLHSVPVRLSVEEQARRVNAIEEISFSSFQPKTFMRTRTPAVNLQDIPLPRDESSWRENPKLLIDSSLYCGTNAEGRKQMWKENLAKLQKEMISESIQ